MATELDDPFAEVRIDALKRANKVRIRRAQLKRELKAGRNPARVLRRPPAAARGMRIEEFLRALPMIGRRRADRILTATRVSPDLALERLGQYEREAIIRSLHEKGGNLY